MVAILVGVMTVLCTPGNDLTTAHALGQGDSAPSDAATKQPFKTVLAASGALGRSPGQGWGIGIGQPNCDDQLTSGEAGRVLLTRSAKLNSMSHEKARPGGGTATTVFIGAETSCLRRQSSSKAKS